VIEAARRSLAAGDARSALERLLEAWRERPAPFLAEAIDAVGVMAAYGMHAPSGAMPLYRDENWLLEAARGDVVMRQRLVETITETTQRREKLLRALALVAAGRDPRTAMALVAIAASRGMVWDGEFSTVWNPLFEMIGEAGDPRVREALAKVAWEDVVIGTPRLKQTFRQRIEKYDAKLAKVLPTAPALAASEVQILEEMIAIARAPTETEVADGETDAALLAAVHAAPGDLGVRAIYADYLQERGDPRGELIVLQLAHPPGTREPPEVRLRLQQLFGQHAAKWLGELSACVEYEGYGHGFVEAVKFKKVAGYESAYVIPPPDPFWSTVRKVTGGVPASDALPMPILERALEIDHRGMRVLARLAKPPPLCEIEWRGTDPARDGEAVADFAAIVKRSPSLRLVTIRGEGAEALAWAWRDSSIRQLVVEAPSHRLAHWLDEAKGLDEIVIRHDRWRSTLNAAGELVVRQDYSGNFAEVLPMIERALDRVGDRLTTVEITVSAKGEWRLPERQRMAATLARHPRWAATAKIYGYREPG
jgi:uncharacterized protein (TIGR02996 family)